MVVPSPTFLLVAARKPKIVTSSTSNNLAVQSMTPIVDTHGKERRRAAENLDHFLVQSLCSVFFSLFPIFILQSEIFLVKCLLNLVYSPPFVLEL